jgi:aminoglycoside phosphotransferase (APT) family kinase protein
MAESARDNSTLPPNVLNWITRAIGPGAAIHTIQPMGGATSSTLHALEVDYRKSRLKLVLRQFTNAEWLASEPDLALHEAANLRKAARADVPTPEVIAYDETGADCGIATILMTHLPGSVNLKPANLDGWLRRLAEAILPIHALEVGNHQWHYAPYNDITQLRVPDWSQHPDLWRRAIEIVTGPRPPTPESFIHRDYHPNNVLWQNGQVSGLVDWPNGCRGAAGIDLAWCRANLIQLYGIAAADQFLQYYETLAGSSFQYHPFWDLIALIEVLPDTPEVYPPWVEFGMDHITSALMIDRNDQFLVSVMDRF